MKKKLLLLAITLFLTLSYGTAQESEKKEELLPEIKLICWNRASAIDYIFPLAEIVSTNMFVKDFAIYVMGQDWKETSFDTLKANLTTPWIWDISSFQKNQGAHAYFGSLYFTASRSNGLSFAQSLLYTGTGSFLWETVQEAGTNSLNDFLTTTFAGAVLGEQLFRLGNEAFAVHPLLGFIIDPLGTFNYFIRGRQPEQGQSKIYSIELSAGPAFLFSSVNYGDNDEGLFENQQEKNLQGFFDMKIVYQDPYNHNSKELMDQFETELFLAKDTGGYKLKADFDSTLFSRGLGDAVNKDKTLGLSYNYDVTYSSRMWLSTNSTGLFFKQRNNLNAGELIWGLEGDYIFLGVTDSIQKVSKGKLCPKAYTFTNGPELKFYLGFNSPTAGNFSLKGKGAFLFSYGQAGEMLIPEGDYFVAEASASYSHKIFAGLSAGLKADFTGKYQLNPSSDRELNENEFSASIFASYIFN